MEPINNVAKKISNEESVQRNLTIITDLLRNIKYGYIQITIQDSRVVQIDKTEKLRFNDKKSKKIFKMVKAITSSYSKEVASYITWNYTYRTTVGTINTFSKYNRLTSQLAVNKQKRGEQT